MRRRLQVILSHAGIASRRKAAQIIEDGRIRVNGIVVREKGFQFDPDEVKIELDGKILQLEKKVYYVLNKPKGFITTVKDERDRKTVLDLIPRPKARIYPVGRLDKDTEGVLLLTNDGTLAHRLTHPRFGVEKIYMVQIKGQASIKDVKALEKGVYLDGHKTGRCKIGIVQCDRQKMLLKINMHEGRKRQIRRMIDRIGCKVIKLKRVSYCPITAKGLAVGGYRALSAKEIESLGKSCLIG